MSSPFSSLLKIPFRKKKRISSPLLKAHESAVKMNTLTLFHTNSFIQLIRIIGFMWLMLMHVNPEDNLRNKMYTKIGVLDCFIDISHANGKKYLRTFQIGFLSRFCLHLCPSHQGCFPEQAAACVHCKTTSAFESQIISTACI